MSNKILFGKLMKSGARVLRDANLTQRQWRVWNALHFHACYEGRVFAQVVDMAKWARMAPNHFSEELRKLAKKGLVQRFSDFSIIDKGIIEYGVHAYDAQEQARKRRAHNQRCEAASDEGTPGGDSRAVEVDGHSVQRRPIPFPEVPLPSDRESGSVS